MDAARIAYFLQQYPFREVVGKDGKPLTPARHIMTCPVRLAFAFLDKPKASKPKKDGTTPPGKYSALLIVPPSAPITSLLSLVNEVGTAKFGADLMTKRDEWGKPILSLPIKKQAKLAEKYQGFSNDGVYIDASSNFPVPVVDRNSAPIALPSDTVYSGMWALARLRVYTFDNETKGIGLGLVAIQKLADDEQFQGGNVTAEFGVIGEHPGASAGSATPPANDALASMLA